MGAPPLYLFTRLAGYYFAEKQTRHICYMAGDVNGSDIIDIYRNADGWHTTNLSTTAHETVQALDGPSGFVLDGLQQVFFPRR